MTATRINLNDLPVVITQPGDYITRSGDRATVHEVSSHTDLTCTSFGAKGSKWRMYRGKYRPGGYTIWHRSGRCYPLRESGSDIVGALGG
jgi:hypothetical protein